MRRVEEQRSGEPCCKTLALAFDVVSDLVDLVKDISVAVNKIGDFAIRVHDRGVIAAAEGASYLRQRLISQLPAEIHGNLSGVGETFGATRADKVSLGDAKVARSDARRVG